MGTPFRSNGLKGTIKQCFLKEQDHVLKGGDSDNRSSVACGLCATQCIPMESVCQAEVA